MRILVTGGAGFIGSTLVRHLIQHTPHHVLNVDVLTYAGSQQGLAVVEGDPRYAFSCTDITDRPALEELFARFQPDAVMHLAAETHVDRSIDGSAAFIHSNLLGTYTLLETARSFWNTRPAPQKEAFRFLHVSTDEVFGDLGDTDEVFHETSPYAPSSPYSASKAGSDHLVRAWQRTYGLPTMVTHCSNNYGPHQHPEKLIPRTITHALQGKIIPLYGDGRQVRDWLYVEDHVQALMSVLIQGRVGETYLIGGNNECRNIDLVRKVCDLLERYRPAHPAGVRAYRELIRFVRDRPGHDVRYALDAGKIRGELGWEPATQLDHGLEKTVRWYLDAAGLTCAADVNLISHPGVKP